MDRTMFDTPVLPRLETILAEVRSGALVIPEFQRPFVWDDDRRLQLLDSIVKGMPIGSLLVWRTSRRDLRTYERLGGLPIAGPPDGSQKVNYLIDGHQRVSTLFGALFPGEREGADQDVRWPVYYRLDAKDRPAFELPPRRGAPPADWVPLDLLLDGDKLFDFTQRLRQSGRRDLAKEAERLANVFRDYIIPIVPLVTEELNVVTDAFVRINSQGKSMSEAHMLRALTHLGTIDTDRHFKDVRARLEPLGWGAIDDQILVNVLKAQLGLDVYASDVRGVQEKLLQDAAPLSRLADVLEEAVGFLAQVGVCGPGVLPYAYQLVTLAALAGRFRGILSAPDARGPLRRWFWVTSYTGEFSGATGNKIRDGISDLADLLAGNENAVDMQRAPIKALNGIRVSTGRSRAFLLFLAQLPGNEEARRRRQERLGTGDAAAALRLFASSSGTDPGNRVIAAPAELRALRKAVGAGAISPEMADEFAIPAGALAALPDRGDFLDERGAFLIEQEKAFIETFGLSVSDAE